MFHAPLPSPSPFGQDMSGLLDLLARSTSRPRYAFMLLNLIADRARPDGSAGPLIAEARGAVPIRDWLSDALTPMGQRDPRRLALAHRVRDELAAAGKLPEDEGDAARLIEDEVRLRVRAAGKTNLSRTVSELVKAGLLRRHYQGYRVDHHNRGAQRQAVYTLAGAARGLLGRGAPAPVAAQAARPRQAVLPF